MSPNKTNNYLTIDYDQFINGLTDEDIAEVDSFLAEHEDLFQFSDDEIQRVIEEVHKMST